MYICTLYKIWYHFSSTLNRGVRCSGHIYVSALLSNPSKQFWDLKEEGTIFIIPGSNLSDVINNNTRLCSFVKVFPSCLGRVSGGVTRLGRGTMCEELNLEMSGWPLELQTKVREVCKPLDAKIIRDGQL